VDYKLSGSKEGSVREKRHLRAWRAFTNSERETGKKDLNKKKTVKKKEENAEEKVGHVGENKKAKQFPKEIREE